MPIVRTKKTSNGDMVQNETEICWAQKQCPLKDMLRRFFFFLSLKAMGNCEWVLN